MEISEFFDNYIETYAATFGKHPDFIRVTPEEAGFFAGEMETLSVISAAMNRKSYYAEIMVWKKIPVVVQIPPAPADPFAWVKNIARIGGHSRG